MGFTIIDIKGIEHEFHESVIDVDSNWPRRIQLPSVPPSKMAVIVQAPVNQVLIPHLDYIEEGDTIRLIKNIRPTATIAFADLDNGGLFWALNLKTGPLL